MPDPTLLVADDDPGLRESLERTLTREGYRVVVASDGRAALERVQGGDIDLVVTDLKMPGLSGIELLHAVKTVAPDLDVILLTAFGTIEEAVKAMKDGAYDFITKPFQRQQLVRVVRAALERRDLIRQNRALQEELAELLSGALHAGFRTGQRDAFPVGELLLAQAVVLRGDQRIPVPRRKLVNGLAQGEGQPGARVIPRGGIGSGGHLLGQLF